MSKKLPTIEYFWREKMFSTSNANTAKFYKLVNIDKEIEIVREYSKLVAQHVLECVAEKAEIDFKIHSIRAGNQAVFSDATINKSSILNSFDINEIK